MRDEMVIPPPIPPPLVPMLLPLGACDRTVAPRHATPSAAELSCSMNRMRPAGVEALRSTSLVGAARCEMMLILEAVVNWGIPGEKKGCLHALFGAAESERGEASGERRTANPAQVSAGRRPPRVVRWGLDEQMST